MKTRLVSIHDSMYLFNSDGESQRVSPTTARDFLLNFSSEKYCGSKDETPLGHFLMSDAASIIIAEVGDDGVLLIKNEEIFRDIILKTETEFLSVQEYANLHGKGISIVRRLCQNHRIPGTLQIGTVYIIPAHAPYPGRE